MWFLRRMLRIPWTAKKTNEMVLKEAETNRSLMQKIRKQQATFSGHVMRREGLEHFLTTGKTRQEKKQGKKNRENAGQPEVLVGCRKSDGYDVASSRPRRLERHDHQRHEAGHLMMMMTQKVKNFIPPEKLSLFHHS